MRGSFQADRVQIFGDAAASVVPRLRLVLGGIPIGSDASVANNFSGVLDELRISSDVSYPDEFTPQRHFTSNPNTIALYHFDEGRGSVLKDSSGNNHHGKIVGAKWVQADGSPLNSDDPDRRAAEWVLSVGRHLRVREENQTKISELITVADKLPSGRFKVQMVDLTGARQLVTDDGLENLRGLAEITGLVLEHCPKVTDRALKLVGTFKTLKSLSLSVTAVTDAGMPDLRELTELETLSLGVTRVTGRGLEPLRNLRKLRELVFGDDNASSNVVGIAKAAWPDLQILSLPGTALTEAGVAEIASLPTISRLELRVRSTTDEQLRLLAPLQKVSVLRTNRSPISDAGLDHLRPLTGLRILDVQETKVTAAGVAKLQLALPKCNIRWDGLKSATSDNPDRRAAEWVLSAGGKVKVREVSQTKISDEIAIADKLPASLFKVQVVNLFKPSDKERESVTDASLENLRDLTEINEISLNSCRKISDRTLKFLSTLKSLKSLDLTGTPTTDAGVKDLRVLSELTRLELGSTRVSARGLEPLRDLRKMQSFNFGDLVESDAVVNIAKDSWPELQVLSLPGTVLTEAGVTGLSGLPMLASLELRLRDVTDEQLRRITPLQKLTRLRLMSIQLSDAGMEQLAALTNLKDLHLNYTKVTPAGVAKLQQALPKCKIMPNFLKDAAGAPFVTLRNGAVAARHATLEEALDASQSQDVIEVHGNGPFPIGGPKPVTFKQKEFTLKAAAGFRPLFVSAPDATASVTSLFTFDKC